MKALTNVILYDYQTFRDNAFVLFEDKIVAVGDMADFKGAETVVDGKGKFLLPAFINFHTHAYSAFARGFNFNCAPETFTEILEQVWWRLDRVLTLEDVYWSAVAHGKECLRKGVVGIIDHHASGQIIGSTAQVERAMKDVGLHGLTCFEISDRFNMVEAMAENRAMADRTGGPIGLHASMTLSDETLRKIKATFGESPIHCHVSESIDDHHCYGETPMERLSQARLVAPNSLLAHCVHMTESDAALVKSQKGIVVLNPRSNENNGVGDFDYGLLDAFELPLVVGTDGLGADMARSWQTLYYRVKANPKDRDRMSLDSLKKYISESYRIYEVLTDNKLGRFEPGYRFDALLLDYEAYTPVTDATVFAHVFYGLYDDLRIEKMWNGGELCIDGYSLLNNMEMPKDLVESFWRRMEASNESKS